MESPPRTSQAELMATVTTTEGQRELSLSFSDHNVDLPVGIARWRKQTQWVSHVSRMSRSGKRLTVDTTCSRQGDSIEHCARYRSTVLVVYYSL